MVVNNITELPPSHAEHLRVLNSPAVTLWNLMVVLKALANAPFKPGSKIKLDLLPPMINSYLQYCVLPTVAHICDLTLSQPCMNAG